LTVLTSAAEMVASQSIYRTCIYLGMFHLIKYYVVSFVIMNLYSTCILSPHIAPLTSFKIILYAKHRCGLEVLLKETRNAYCTCYNRN